MTTAGHPPGGQESSGGPPRRHLADIAAAVGVEVVEEDPPAPSGSEPRFHGRSSSQRRGPLLRAGGGCAEPGGAGSCRIALTAGAGRCGHGLKAAGPHTGILPSSRLLLAWEFQQVAACGDFWCSLSLGVALPRVFYL